MGRHVAPLALGVCRRTAAAEPQRTEFVEDDRIRRGGNLAAIGQRPRWLVPEGLPR